MLRDDRWAQQLATLDPKQDGYAILHAITNHVFPIDYLIAAELGQLRTFTAPSISRLLHRTGQYEASPRRLDDTRALLSEIFGTDPDDPHHQDCVKHLNALHGFYRISNDDYLFTLSVFFLDFSHWLDRYGRRPLWDAEKTGLLSYFQRLGQAMKIDDIPATWSDFEAWRHAYEAHAVGYDPANAAVAAGILRWATHLVPRPFRRWVPAAVAHFLGAESSELLGLAMPSKVFGRRLERFMAIRRVILRFIDPWKNQPFGETAYFTTYPSYPQGYDPLHLGPPKLVDRIRLTRHDGCPVHRK